MARDDGGAPGQAAGDMSENEARAILGVEETATDDQIRKVHRELMQKLHPDRGGSNYLAAKINEAKARLLKQR
ncbi:MAG TPA: DnaJ domain-containing protein [Hyphomicrobiaceae bacterium]|nr:DnaJ domain-containing protein [Hyphomicrobiaceae bacterium]